MGAPYALGEAMISLAVKEDGEDAANLLFAKPPTTDEHLLDPWTLIADEEPAARRRGRRSSARARRSSTTARSGRRAGCSCWPSALPPLRAIDAADGWGGDSYVAFERDGVELRPDQLPGRHEARHGGDGVQPAGLDGGAARHRRPSWSGTAAMLVFESCDPGRKTVGGPELLGRGPRPRAHPDLPVRGPGRPDRGRVRPVRLEPPDPQLLGRGAGSRRGPADEALTARVAEVVAPCR